MSSPTWSEEMLRTVTRSGWYGVLIYLIFALVYVSAVWHVLRHRPQRVLEHAVIGMYIVAVSVWHTLFNILRLLATSEAACFQTSLLWWGAYLQWKLTLVLLLSLVPVVLFALVLRPRGIRLRNPGCMPGAVTAVLSTMLLHTFFLAVFFGASYSGANQQRVLDEMTLRKKVKDLQEKIEMQNTTSEGIRRPADGSPKPSM